MEIESKVILGLLFGFFLLCAGGMALAAYEKRLVTTSPAPLETACALDSRHVACTILAGRK